MKKLLQNLLSDLGLFQPYHHRAFRRARIWSNQELEKFGGLFHGTVVNVSAWEDKDKEGRRYRDYFPSCASYHITNFGTDQGTLQGAENESFLDLEAELQPGLVGHFDVVFNHTTLEHVYEFRTAFRNLCRLSKDIVIIVVPWLQPLHTNYGDYWRFSPQAVVRLFEEQEMKTLHLSWTNTKRASVYVFAIASRNPGRWKHAFPRQPDGASSQSFTTLPVDFAGRFAFGGWRRS